MYDGKCKNPSQLVVYPSQSRMSTLEPKSGLFGVEKGVGGEYQFEVLQGQLRLGSFTITIRVPACGDNTFKLEWKEQAKGVVPVLQHLGKGGTANAHRHVCVLNTGGSPVLEANTPDSRLQTLEYAPGIGLAVRVGHVCNHEHAQASRAAIAATAGIAAAVAAVFTGGVAAGAVGGYLAAAGAPAAAGVGTVAGAAAAGAAGSATTWAVEKTGNAMVGSEARTAGDTSLKGLVTGVSMAAKMGSMFAGAKELKGWNSDTLSDGFVNKLVEKAKTDGAVNLGKVSLGIAGEYVQEPGNRGISFLIPNCFNVAIAGGTNKGAKTLSCCREGKVDLFSRDDESGRQRWQFFPTTQRNGDPAFQIHVVAGTMAGRNMLSCRPDGYVDLFERDDESGRQKWVLLPLGNDMFNIRVAGGTNSGKSFLSCRADGYVYLYCKDDGSGRQRWRLQLLV